MTESNSENRNLENLSSLRRARRDGSDLPPESFDRTLGMEGSPRQGSSEPHQIRRIAPLVAALSLLGAPFVASASAPGGAEPVPHEDCTPVRTVIALRQQVAWWAREGNMVALAGQFVDESESVRSTVAWRLVITDLDRNVVDTRRGVSKLVDGFAIGHVNFDGKDSAGHPFAPGLYVYRFEASGYESSGAFLRVYASDETPEKVEDTREPLASSSNPSVPYSYFFGAQHAHTNYSDGGTAVATCTGSKSSPHPGASPVDAFNYAKTSGGVDWICVIEHNHLIDDACGACTTAQVRQRYQDGLAAATASTTASFVGLYGMEYGVIGNTADHEGHVAFYDVTKLLSWEAYADVTTSKTDYLSLWNTANTPANQGVNGAAGAFCHPKTSDYASWAQNAAGLNVITGLAVISGPAFNKTTDFADGGSRYAGPTAGGSDMYNWALQRGWKIGPEAHADNHCWNFGNSTRNRTVVLAPSLSKANVMGALKARRFYATSDRNAQMFFGTSDYAHVMGEVMSTSSATLNLLAWVGDPDGATVSSAKLYQGNPAAGTGSPTLLTMTSSATNTYTASVTVPATGQAYFYVYVTLSNGAELWSSPIWISKSGACGDTTAPTATVTAPTATTVTGTVSVTATGADNVGVTGMTLKIDGAQVATSASGSISYSWNTTGLAAGSSHTIVATSTDACGNAGTSSTKTVTIGSTCTDTTLPTATVTAPTASTVTGTVSVTATGTDNVAVTGMTLKIDGTQVATSTSGSISYSWNTTGLTAGSSHTIVATASDACGNVRTSTTKTVTIGSTCTDTTLPTATVTAPTASTVSGTVSVTATGTDNVAVTGMTLKIDGTQVATSASGSISYSWNTSALAAGSSHTIVATSTDACGNAGTSATKTVTIASTFANPIVNPGFEAATATPWGQSGTYELISGSGTASNGSVVNPHAGTKMAWMGGYDSGDDLLYQNFTVPNVTGNVNLSFWTRIVTTDGTTTAYDHLYLDVYNSTGTTRLGTLIHLTNQNASSGWVQKTALSLNTWKGQTIRLRFHATTDTSNSTDFFVDDLLVTNP